MSTTNTTTNTNTNTNTIFCILQPVQVFFNWVFVFYILTHRADFYRDILGAICFSCCNQKKKRNCNYIAINHPYVICISSSLHFTLSYIFSHQCPYQDTMLCYHTTVVLIVYSLKPKLIYPFVPINQKSSLTHTITKIYNVFVMCFFHCYNWQIKCGLHLRKLHIKLH